MGLPRSIEELDEEYFFLMFQHYGYGLGQSYESIMAMPPRFRKAMVQRQADEYERINDENGS